jgi:hypothetical protein
VSFGRRCRLNSAAAILPGNRVARRPFTGTNPKEQPMTDNKKKGDFDQWQKEDKGGDKKQRDDRNTDSRTGGQNSGGGGRD